MISKNDDGGYDLRVGDVNVFLGVIEEQYKVYKETIETIPDFLEKESELEEFIRKNNNQIFPPYICSIFTALFLEAFIYDYCARKKSSSMAQHLDKLDPPAKWIIGTKLFNKNGIDSSKKGYSDLKKIFQVRNKLAHNKSKEYDMESDKPMPRTELISPDDCIDMIKNILTELVEIDNEEIYAKILIARLNNIE